MKQLDLFKNTEKISESTSKYKRTLDQELPKYQFLDGLPDAHVHIYCECKKYLKVHYDYIEPTVKMFWGMNIEEYKKGIHIARFFCPHCGKSLFLQSAKIRSIKL